jgi:hypothetical protein
MRVNEKALIWLIILLGCALVWTGVYKGVRYAAYALEMEAIQ